MCERTLPMKSDFCKNPDSKEVKESPGEDLYRP